MSWELFETPPQPGTRFVALFSDGSGGEVFYRDPAGRVFDSVDDDLFDAAIDDTALCDWLWDAGYLFWSPLPEGHWTGATNNGWRRSASDPPKSGTRFVALVKNLKGVIVFVYSENKRLIDGAGDDFFGRRVTKIDLANRLFSTGLQSWAPLPDGMKLFFEEDWGRLLEGVKK